MFSCLLAPEPYSSCSEKVSGLINTKLLHYKNSEIWSLQQDHILRTWDISTNLFVKKYFKVSRFEGSFKITILTVFQQKTLKKVNLRDINSLTLWPRSFFNFDNKQIYEKTNLSSQYLFNKRRYDWKQ